MGLIDTGERIARHAWRIPVLGRILAMDYARSFARMPPNKFRGVFPGFAEAERSIPSGRRIGYDHDALAGMYRNRMERACQSDYAVLFWLQRIVAADTLLFDFGGHVGVSFYGWKQYLGYPPGLRWRVCDVPAIVEEGARLAEERGANGLEFTSSIADGRDCNVLLVAGSLQYVDMDMPQLLQAMGNRPQHVLINKMPLYEGETFVTVQSTGRAFHPYRIGNREEFEASVTGLGYRLVDYWTNRETHCRIPFTRGRHIDAYSGYYFVRDETTG